MDGKLIYYNKVDGNSYKFCFDPLCSNVYPEGKCPYVMIAPTPLASTIVYCEKNARFYAARGQKICSMGFDAGEIKTECSLGEDGNLNSVDYDRNYIKNLRCAGDYLFFLYKDDVTGHNKLMRYSIKKGDLVPLTSAENEWMIGYEIADGYIFCKMLDENNNIVFYTADYDFDNLHIVSDPINPNSFGSSMG
ncbi:MAG: hypothetical protein KBS59_07500, partial [Clostridiales bacterium]|nr:hypothetical protein [Clostridiales bacterium]